MKTKESLKYLQRTIKKIEPCIKEDDEIEEIKLFLNHLEKACKLCNDISEKHLLKKILESPADNNELRTLQSEINEAHSKLSSFMSAKLLTMFCENIDFQNKELHKIAVLQENNMAGINIVTDKAIRRPSAPLGFTVQEDKNEFILSWKPCEGDVSEYQLSYDEHEDSIVSVGNVTTLTLGSPKVQPGNVYPMKIRGINKGGKGEWSDIVVGQFTKPLPQRPEISNLLLRATIAVVTVKLPKAICSTESPITCVEISHVTATSKKLTCSDFKIEPGNYTHTFTVRELHPDTKYNFRAKAKNTEGWSKPSDLREGLTLSLPPIPARPNPPIIKACSSTEVKLIVQVPENTHDVKSPIIRWRVIGYGTEKEEIDASYPISVTSFADKYLKLCVSNLNPNQQYTLKVFAKNELGWSQPSERFTIHIASPSVPINVRVSSKRSHSLIKIRWNAPDSSLITHYEIMKKTRKGSYDEKPITVPANKFSATFTNLKHNTRYCFRVRTCNGTRASTWSKDIETNTRIHKGIKAAFAPVVWIVGTATAPIVMPIAAGMAAGEIRKEKSGRDAAVAAGTIGGMVLGTVGAPLVGAAWGHAFVHGIDDESDQSDDEDAVIIEC